jgi:hypothetical protein
MSRSSARRGQVEPLAALVALAAVCAGVALYADALVGAVPSPDRDVARPALVRAHDHLTDDGVARPARLGTVPSPAGYRANLTLRAADREWVAGPAPPDRRVDAADRVLGVRLGPGRVAAGRLRVEVWQ